MNSLDLLMGMDYEKIAVVPEKKLEIKRLSGIIGEPFIVTVRAISSRRMADLTSTALKDNGNVDYSKLYDVNIRIVLAGLVDPDAKDSELLSHYNAATPADLIGKIFTGAEIGQLAEAIRDLSGYGDDVVEEIKN